MGGPDLGEFKNYHSQLVRLFNTLDGIVFSPTIDLFGIAFYVDGAAYRWPVKAGVSGVRLTKLSRSISANIHVTDGDPPPKRRHGGLSLTETFPAHEHFDVSAFPIHYGVHGDGYPWAKSRH